jgi:Taurine catabolism dioxygenase TauD, TfdA family
MMVQALARTGKANELSDLAQAVCERGWLQLPSEESTHSLAVAALRFAHRLGEPLSGRHGSAVEALAPLPVETANPNSLSVLHGLGTFPLHIDGAHRTQPPRFILLACANPGSSPVPTVLSHFRDLPLRDDERRKCESAPFLVRNGRRSFYSSIVDRSRPFVRFDQGCMFPTSVDGEQAVAAVASRAAECGPTTIHWKANDILAIDNWQVLHGRGLSSATASPDRCILRVSIQ